MKKVCTDKVFTENIYRFRKNLRRAKPLLLSELVWIKGNKSYP